MGELLQRHVSVFPSAARGDAASCTRIGPETRTQVYANYLKNVMLIGTAVLIAVNCRPASAQPHPEDRTGCMDHPLVKRYAGSHISRCDSKEFCRLTLSGSKP